MIKHLCTACKQSLKLTEHSLQEEEVYCFEQPSAAQELLRRYEKKRFKHLEEVIVSFMIVKFVSMQWKMPTLITAGVKEEVSFFSSNHLNRLLAKTFAKRLHLPYEDLLQYTVSDQVHDEKGNLLGGVKRKRGSQEENILIIQDTMNPLTKTYKRLFTEAKLLTFLSEAFNQNCAT
jgi:predicted nucleotide-binding protein (sugar kinase/HSP70/actin superfamily)